MAEAAAAAAAATAAGDPDPSPLRKLAASNLGISSLIHPLGSPWTSERLGRPPPLASAAAMLLMLAAPAAPPLAAAAVMDASSADEYEFMAPTGGGGGGRRRRGMIGELSALLRQDDHVQLLPVQTQILVNPILYIVFFFPLLAFLFGVGDLYLLAVPEI